MGTNFNLTTISNALENPKFPILIAGPCSAESEEQLLATAKELQKINRLTAFRAGVWKPRTRPGMFEGIGVPALQWMQRVKQETGLQTAIEVATAEHTELALEAGIDILWVGARTTVNPFSVQEIANVLKGTDKTVLVKNPVSIDLQLWIGALERINKAGITKLGAIHRGFSTSENSVFRNAPIWQIPLELRSLCPKLPIICDPSHITGKAELVPFIAQKALDLDMQGLMIEVHPNPAKAWSDAAQQLTPLQFIKMITDLQLRLDKAEKLEIQTELEEYRKEIDAIDELIIQQMAQRFQISRKIGNYKKRNNLLVLQMSRWENILEQRVKIGTAMGISNDFMTALLKLVHEESINQQTEVMKQ